MNDRSTTVRGFDACGIAAGIKKQAGALDMALIACPTPCRAAAVFTRNAFPAAPVQYDRHLLTLNPEGIHGVIINAGNANACTGPQGDANTRLTAEMVERELDASDHSIFVMSTGVIGVQLPMETVLTGAKTAAQSLRPDGWLDAATAIMTTDTHPKLVSRAVAIGDVDITVAGIAKGAGMIHPDMATMLAVVATDAAVSRPLLQLALGEAVESSFNRITIDGDTSTNDTVLLLANGAAGNREITDMADNDYSAFVVALAEVCTELAQAIVRDGEGATKFVAITVSGATSDEDAHHIANVIGTSPLVKTAFYGSDANWGRILAALGRSGRAVDPARCSLSVDGGPSPNERMGPLQLVDAGTPTDYAERDAAARFAHPELDVHIELGMGDGSAIVWTSDFSHEYVSINADYRT